MSDVETRRVIFGLSMGKSNYAAAPLECEQTPDDSVPTSKT